jgi:hypothetical protein
MGLLRRSLALLLLVAATPAAAADPFVTVKPPAEGPANSAFWILEMESRPRVSSVAGVELDRINAALPQAEPRWCAAEAFTADSFTSVDAAIRAEIRQYLAGPDGNVFETETRITGRPAIAVVGNARTCAGRVVPFLLLVDHLAQVSRVLYVRTFTDWTPFITLRADGNRLIVSSCLECDHAEILSYNRRTRRFSWRSAGP